MGVRKTHCAGLEVLVLLGIESVGVNATANPTTSLEDVDLVTALFQKKGRVKASDAGSNDANSKRCLRHIWGESGQHEFGYANGVSLTAIFYFLQVEWNFLGVE